MIWKFVSDQFVYTGAIAVLGSMYGKPNKAVHISNVNCVGGEERIDDCTKTSISLSEGKTTYKSANVAGVKCLPPPDPTCIGNPTGVPDGSACTPGMLTLFGGNSDNEGTLRYCYKGQWSPMCSLSEAAASVACKQLGYTQYTSMFPICNETCMRTHSICLCFDFFPTMLRCCHIHARRIPFLSWSELL